MKPVFRCENCGKICETKEDCCGVGMVDLSSPGCMACQGCGHH